MENDPKSIQECHLDAPQGPPYDAETTNGNIYHTAYQRCNLIASRAKEGHHERMSELVVQNYRNHPENYRSEAMMEDRASPDWWKRTRYWIYGAPRPGQYQDTPYQRYEINGSTPPQQEMMVIYEIYSQAQAIEKSGYQTREARRLNRAYREEKQEETAWWRELVREAMSEKASEEQDQLSVPRVDKS